MDKNKKIESWDVAELNCDLTEGKNRSNQAKLTWETPEISVMQISKLTAGFSPRFRDFTLPRLGAGS